MQQGQHLLPFPPRTPTAPATAPVTLQLLPMVVLVSQNTHHAINTPCIFATNQPNFICILADTTFSASLTSSPTSRPTLDLFLHPRREGVAGARVGGSLEHSVCPRDTLPRALLLMRLRWLLEVWDSSVACWWFESTGLVAMMLSLYLFIRDSLALSLPAQEDLEAKSCRDKDFKKGGS